MAQRVDLLAPFIGIKGGIYFSPFKATPIANQNGLNFNSCEESATEHRSGDL